jgi:hypothetical protein
LYPGSFNGSVAVWNLQRMQQMGGWQCAQHAGASCLLSHVTRHTLHVTRHTSHVTRHTSHVAAPVHDVSWVREGTAVASVSGENDAMMRWNHFCFVLLRYTRHAPVVAPSNSFQLRITHCCL